jgi:hypothetical protein
VVVRLAGVFADYDFVPWTEVGPGWRGFEPLDASERVRFDDLREALALLRRLGLGPEEPGLALRPVLLELGAGAGHGGLDHAGGVERLALAMVRGELLVFRELRPIRVSERPTIAMRPEHEAPPPEPVELEEPRVTARLAVELPTRARARIEQVPPPRAEARSTPVPTRARAKVSPRAPRVEARVVVGPKRATAVVTSRPTRARAKLST